MKKSQAIDIADLYAFKLGPLWAALKAEHLSLWMLCGYFFFEYVRPQTLYPVLDVLPYGQLFLLAALATAFMDKSVRIPPNPLNNLFIVFTMVIVLSSLLAFRPSVSLDYASVFGSWLFVYFLVISIVNTEKRLILFLLAYCLFNFKMSQHGAVVWTKRGFSFADYGITGSPGWFKNSGEYAIQMLIFGTLATSMVYALKDNWGRYKRWFFIAAAGTSYMSIMGASSRGAQLALLVILVWWVLKLKGGFKALIGMAFFFIILFNILPEEQKQRFEEMGEDRNSLQRLAYWDYAFNSVIPENPILGVGYNNWLDYVLFKVPQGMGPMQMVQECHNIFIQAASELGFIGLLVFLILIIFAFVNNSRTRAIANQVENKFIFYLAYGLDAGLIGYLVAGMFVTVLYYPFFWVQIAMIVAVNSVAQSLKIQKRAAGESKQFADMVRQ